MSFKKIEKKSGPVSAHAVESATVASKVEAPAPAKTAPVTPVAAPAVTTAVLPKVAAAAMPATAAPAAVIATAIPADTAALIRALRHPSADTAREAAISLGKVGGSAAVAALSEVVANTCGFFHSVVRAAACASLGQLKDASAVPALIVAISDSMAEASAEAVRALAKLGDDRAIEPLIAVLRNEHGFYLPVVRLAAVTAVKQFKSAKAAAALLIVASNANEDAVVRAAATA